MSTKGMSWEDRPLSARSLAARDWLIGVLAFVALAGIVAGIGRLFLGLQASTSLNDVYSWGIWIGFDFSLIAFAGVGFTMAAVVHIFHLERFHAALRPALLAGFLGYMAVLALLVLDLGRWDRFYNFILFWNVHSPLFEISWCVLLYSTVLIIEVSPDFLQYLRWQWPLKLAKWVIVPVSIIGVTLSTLHQSTLGTLYLNMPYRLHPLWYTPLLPVLFYVSSIMAGLSLAIVVYKLAQRLRNKPEDVGLCAGLARGVQWTAVLYVVLKLAELVWAQEWPLLADGRYGLLWLAELLLGAMLPAVLLSVPGWRFKSAVQWAATLLVLGGVLLNRFDATLFGQVVRANAPAYSPHILEWLSTLGIMAAAALAWLLTVRFVLRDEDHPH